MKIERVIYKRIAPDKRIEATKVERGTGVILKRIKSTKPMQRDSQDGSSGQ